MFGQTSLNACAPIILGEQPFQGYPIPRLPSPPVSTNKELLNEISFLKTAVAAAQEQQATVITSAVSVVSALTSTNGTLSAKLDAIQTKQE